MQYDGRGYYYLRLSKEDGDVESGKAEESCSISSQRTCVSRYLQSRPDLGDGFEEIVDDGYSGTTMNRPGMNRLIRMTKEGKVSCIIVRDLSRFSRDYLDAGYYLEYIFPAYGVRFISINDGFDSASLGETTGGLELAIRNLINQMYSRDLSMKIKSSVDMKKRKGEYVYGTAPYGYKKGEKKNTIQVDDEAAAVVRKIFAWAADGITITQIAKKLNDTEIPTPSVYLSAVRGKYKTRAFWTYESVRNILHNRIYTGDTVPFKSHVVRVGSSRVKSISEDDWEIIPDTHEALVSREVYRQAHQVIKSNKKSRKNKESSLFTSYLVCGCCGNKLSKGKAQNKNWLCSSSRYQDRLECKKVRIREEVLTEVLLHAIRNQCDLLDVTIKKLIARNDDVQKESELISREIRKKRLSLERIQAGKMSIYEKYVESKLTKEEYIGQKQKMKISEEELKYQVKVLEQKHMASIEAEKAHVAGMQETKGWDQYKGAEHLSVDLMRELVDHITVFPDGIIYITWNFRDEIIHLNNVSEASVKESKKMLSHT